MSAMVQVEDAWLRAADISHMRWERAFSYTKLIITMRDGHRVEVRDYQGSAYAAEARVLAAIKAEAAA